MPSIEKWNEVLRHSNKISDVSKDISSVMAKIADILLDSETMFGLHSEEMDEIFDSLLDLRSSKIDDLLTFIDISAERRVFGGITSFQ